MTNYQDASQQVNIGIIAEGYAQIASFVANPNHGISGISITLTATINNTGTTDTLWRKMYLNGSQLGSEATANVVPGTPWVTSLTFNLNQNSTAYCTAGYVNASNTHVLTATSATITITLDQFAHAAFVGTPTYPSSVDPGVPFTITYPVKNDGLVAGDIWGHLYDFTFNQIVTGTEWVATSVGAGQLVTPTPTANISITSPLSGELRIGHVE
jgi:hypothetical protein